MPSDRTDQIVTLTLHRFDGVRGRLWAFVHMGLSRPALGRLAGLRFWKLFGSGSGEGFTPVPNTAVWGILGVWDDMQTARAMVDNAAVYRQWRDRAAETTTLYLSPFQARGAWEGGMPFDAGGSAPQGPVAALTRATVAPHRLRRFWSRVPAISARVGSDPAVLFKIGLGERPWFQQVTFSVWPDASSMDTFARTPGTPHAAAIAAVRREGWFREELYARFALVAQSGTWAGKPMITGAALAPLAAE